MTECIQVWKYIIHTGTTVSEIVHIEDWFGVKMNIGLKPKVKK